MRRGLLRWTTRPLALAGLLGALLMLAGTGLLVGNAQQQVRNAKITVIVDPYPAVDADVLRQIKRNATTGAILDSLSTGLPTRPQHWTHFSTDALGGYSYASDGAFPGPLVPQTPVPTGITPRALPLAAGLGILLGTLFLAAARWRSRQRPTAAMPASS
jgi:hypothetical protein